MGRRWYVGRTQPRMEYLAADELIRDGFEIFFPCVTAPRPQMGRTDMPLFPGYLFLRFDPNQVKSPLFTTRHRMVGLVRFGDEAAWLLDETITELNGKLADIKNNNGLWRRYHVGDRVEVISNGLESLAEVVEDSKSPQSRVKVLLEFMGRQIPAQVPWQDLTPAEDKPWKNQEPRRRTRGHGRWIKGAGSRAPAIA